MYTILGAGLSGIASSYFLGHENCFVFEKNNYSGGHVHSEKINDFIWDEGPHVSFTKNDFVKNLLANNVNNKFYNYPVETANYYKGHWIPHPAQSNLYALPLELKERCLSDFLDSREKTSINPANYEEWLKIAFGETFYNEFPRAYTKKYWTVEPSLLTTDWVGERVFFPNIEEVKAGYQGPLDKQTHYISEVRYPQNGGFNSYTNKIIEGININLNKQLSKISFKEKKIDFKDGSTINYDQLINTIPITELIIKSDAPNEIKLAANNLACSSLLLINIAVDHETQYNYNWMYVYDEDKYSTRINCTELLSPNNAPKSKSGVQVEVYFSKYKNINETIESIENKVKKELVEMGLIKNIESIIYCKSKWVEYANIICDHNRKNSLNKILEYLSKYGLIRNDQDLDPMTDWNKSLYKGDNEICLIGRFAEWKYYWTDDCILSAKTLK
jgi:protoporphyrinogen oxidase